MLREYSELGIELVVQRPCELLYFFALEHLASKSIDSVNQSIRLRFCALLELGLDVSVENLSSLWGFVPG